MAHMSPALNGSTALQHFERGNAVKIRNGIMFDFYPGLPHILYILYTCMVILQLELSFETRSIPMNFLPALQELDLCDEVWSCPRNLVGPDVMFLVNPEPTIKVADLFIHFPS